VSLPHRDRDESAADDVGPATAAEDDARTTAELPRYPGGHDSGAATTLPMPAAGAFEVFCDIEAIPRWVSVVQSVRVLSRDAAGRGLNVSVLARLERATIGYLLTYRYDDDALVATWETPAGSTTVVSGRAQFI